MSGHPQPRDQADMVVENVLFVRNVPAQPDMIGLSGVLSQELVAGGSIFMKKEYILPKASAIAHYHPCPTVIYILAGKVRVDFGLNMDQSDFADAGDAIFIPSGMPHRPVNVSEELPAECIVVRTTPRDEVIPVQTRDPHV